METAGNKDMGLYLFRSVSSVFLCIGTTFAILRLSGNIHVFRIWLVINVSGAAISFFTVLMCLMDKSS